MLDNELEQLLVSEEKKELYERELYDKKREVEIGNALEDGKFDVALKTLNSVKEELLKETQGVGLNEYGEKV